MATTKKKIKRIKIDADKCNGCRGCEIVCSSFHATPKYSEINPARSRIQVISHRLKNIWLPVFAGEYAPAECMGRDVYVIDGKEYDECGFCRAACPSRDMFKEPDSGLPLKCDMCEGEEKPKCVEWWVGTEAIPRRWRTLASSSPISTPSTSRLTPKPFRPSCGISSCLIPS